MSIVDEVPGYIQVFSDGTVVRFDPEIVHPSDGHSDDAAFISKDVAIDPAKPITARIFLPNNSNRVGSADHASSLPVVVYFHGGGFCFGSTAWVGYHHFLGHLAAAARAIIVSVDYRLAPEHRLPAAYDDCFLSLEWLRRQATEEPWLARADLSRVFLSGDSAGGNICHHVAVRTAIRGGGRSHEGIPIRGVLAIQSYFGSERRTEQEAAEGAAEAVKFQDMFWRLSLPLGANRDYYGCNIETAMEGEEVEWERFPAAAAVFVAGKDFLKERGVAYADFLRRKGVKRVKVVEEAAEGHAYFVFHPESEAAHLLQRQMSDFINSS